jgi:HEAT repeat protein
MAVRNVEAELVKLKPLEDAPLEEVAAPLRKALTDRVNVMVAKAAKIAAARQVRELIPDLLRAFDRLLEKAAERDPQCWGKNAIAKALVELDYRESAPFIRAIRHIQMEPVWGGQEDTASNLRGICALALVACSDLAPEKTLRYLVDALADEKATVRVEAVRALAQMDGALVLRLKAHTGDREANVIGQVFDSLLQIEGAEALSFVAQFLRAPSDGVREEAALAMGASRLVGAVPLLREAWESLKEEVLLRAISASRHDEAIEFLLDMVRNGRARDRAAALEALSIHKDSPEIWSRVEVAAKDEL